MTDGAGTGALRLFAAVEIPPDWRAALSRAASSLREATGNEYRWVRPELMHVTLAFLGYQEPSSLETIEGALQVAARDNRPFDLRVGKLGTFGPPHAISVVWVGISEGNAPLSALHQSVAAALTSAGIAFDRKPLVPHITLARGRRPVNRDASLRLASAIGRAHLPGLSASVPDIVLFRSRLGPSGPSYEAVRRFPLRNS